MTRQPKISGTVRGRAAHTHQKNDDQVAHLYMDARVEHGEAVEMRRREQIQHNLSPSPRRDSCFYALRLLQSAVVCGAGGVVDENVNIADILNSKTNTHVFIWHHD